MTQFSEAEKQLLTAVVETTRKKKAPDRITLEGFGKDWFREDLLSWVEAFESLTQKGLLQEKDGVYLLTDYGEVRGREIRNEVLSQDLSRVLIRIEQSRACASLRERVCGKNLCQFDMMDMEQLDRLMDILDLNGDNKVLDLGCGIGGITEYISDLTGAHIVGVDFAAGAIKRASERTKAKQHRLVFQVENINDLDFPANAFDTIIAIDTLYFVDDLEKTIQQMKETLKPDGQMGIFFSQMITPEDSEELLLPEGTELALVLKKYNLDFQTQDFTESENNLWPKTKQAIEELKSEFESEGNLDLYDIFFDGAKQALKDTDSNRNRRYLYHVKT